MKTTTYISLLRGINVSGQKRIRMAELKKLYESLNFNNIRSYLQSGNLVFDGPLTEPGELGHQIEAAIRDKYGYEVTVFIRDSVDFRRIIDKNPFINNRGEDPTKLYVTFLDRPINALIESDWDNINPGEEALIVGQQEIFIFCPNGYGRARLNNNYLEHKLNLTATTRNWKTINAVYQLAAGK